MGAFLHLRQHTSTVGGQQGKSRYVFFGETTEKALRNWKRIAPPNEPGVFPLTADGLYALLRRLARRAGIEGPFNPHAFRHALARRILLHGGDWAQVSQLLGHSTVVVTVRFYARFRVDELQRFHAKYNRLPLPREESGP